MWQYATIFYMQKYIKLHPHDNVAVCLSNEEIIPFGHKFAVSDILEGSIIYKFGHAIGRASKYIKKDDHVHIHNVAMLEGIAIEKIERISNKNYENIPKTFLGYKRESGRAGIRNYIAVIATVNCSASVVKAICQHFRNIDLSEKNIDGVVPITHTAGCAQAIGGLNFNVLNKTIAGWAMHPNVVANLYIGLGCEGTTYNTIKKTEKEFFLGTAKIERSFGIQDIGGTSLAIKKGIEEINSIISELPRFERVPLPISEIGLALNCGGSDAFSSLTANPALGIASDILVSAGGASVLAEIPECHGAESILYSKAINDSVRNKLDNVFDWWQKYSKLHSVSLNNNLSPGNIAGGITTILEKSLGAVSKGGSSDLVDVVGYSEKIPSQGFALMNTPGFDPVSVTGLVAGGCNIVCFTTGRGSVYGCSIAPTIKISTNNQLFEKMKDDMDFNAGSILDGKNLNDIGEDLLGLIIEVASGKKVKSELLHLGWEEFTPWPIGETL